MPVLSINGTNVSVDDSFLSLSHDDQNATVDEIAASLPKNDVSVSADVAKGAGVGAAQGVLGLAGSVGDLTDLGARGIGAASDKISDLLGVNRYQRPTTPSVLNNIPTEASLQGAVESQTGPFYQPQTGPGKVAQSVAQLLPAVAGGPEGLLARVATRAVAPGVAMEAAKEGTEGTPYQVPAQIAAALAGGVGSTMAANKVGALLAARNAASTTASAIPTTEQLLQTGGAQMRQAADMPLTVKPEFASSAADDIRAAVKGYDPEAAAPVLKAADRLESLGSSSGGVPPSTIPISEVHTIGDQLASLRAHPDQIVRDAAQKGRTALLDSQAGLTGADAVTGDVDAYTGMLRDARGNLDAANRSRAVMGQSEAGIPTTNDFKNPLDPIKALVTPSARTGIPLAQDLGFDAIEQAAAQKAATGTSAGNAARTAADILDLTQHHYIPGIAGAILGHSVAGIPGMLAGPLLGKVAGRIAAMSSRQGAAAVDALVRARSPLAAQVVPQLPARIVKRMSLRSQRIVKSLMSADKQAQPDQVSNG